MCETGLVCVGAGVCARMRACLRDREKGLYVCVDKEQKYREEERERRSEGRREG